jgi:signal peptidase I
MEPHNVRLISPVALPIGRRWQRPEADATSVRSMPDHAAIPASAAEVDEGTIDLGTGEGRAALARRAGAFLTRMARARAPLALKLVLLAVLLTLGRAVLADQYLVPTSSMAPTIAPGDRIFVFKAAYGARVPFTDAYVDVGGGPARGDVILFGDPRGGHVPLVKRVVAFAGETVAMRDGVLILDGVAQPLERLASGREVEHLGDGTHAAGKREIEDFGPVVVPADHLFVMGDNRAASLDSRAMGPLPRRLVRGRVLGVVYGHSAAGFDATRILRPIDD